MSLRTLFLLMGLVSASMVAAVIYTKVIDPPTTRYATQAERRVVERICDAECSRLAPQAASQAVSQEALMAMAEGCIDACLARVLSGRSLR